MLTNKGKSAIEVQCLQLREAITYKLDGIDLLTLACNEIHRSTPGLEAPDIAHCELHAVSDATDSTLISRADTFEIIYVTKRQVQHVKEKTDASK